MISEDHNKVLYDALYLSFSRQRGSKETKADAPKRADPYDSFFSYGLRNRRRNQSMMPRKKLVMVSMNC